MVITLEHTRFTPTNSAEEQVPLWKEDSVSNRVSLLQYD